MRRTVSGVEVEYLGDSSYEFEAFGWYYHVRKERSKWIMDAFDASIQDMNAAYIDSTEHETLKEAVDYAAIPVSGL